MDFVKVETNVRKPKLDNFRKNMAEMHKIFLMILYSGGRRGVLEFGKG